MRHRREIDGLRAVAVVPVILFHAGLSRFSGGFVGVDVFFVISGFLITGLMLEEHAQGTFSVARFYERRARRILPALYLVLIACLPLAAFLMLPSEFESFGRNLAAVIVFASNIRYFLTADYFAQPGAFDPLLHTWSLAVEEQHYLLFPVLLMLLWRGGPRRVLAGTALLTLASFVAAEYAWPRWPMANFFLLPTRLWELGVGALAAIALHGRAPRFPRALAEAGAAGGLLLIAAAVLFFDESTPFPSRYALVPTLGAVAVLVFASPATLAGRLLGLRPMVGIGLVSYSAYLWHQPLFAFARLSSEFGPSRGLMLGLCLVTFGLAWLSWRFVERPFRDRRAIATPRVWQAAAVASLALLVAGGLLPRLLAPTASTPPLLAQFDVPIDARNAYVATEFEAREARGYADDGRPKALILGDSHAKDFYNVVREAGAFAGYDLATGYVSTRCQVYLGPDLEALVGEADTLYCTERAGTARVLDRIRQADVLVIVANWKPWASARLRDTLAAFDLRPTQQVVIVGPKSFRAPNLRLLRHADPARFPEMRVEQTAQLRSAVEGIRTGAPEGRLVDIQALACAPDWTCPAFTPAGELISHDGSHLTRAGARYLGPILFADPLLAPYGPDRTADARPAPVPAADSARP